MLSFNTQFWWSGDRWLNTTEKGKKGTGNIKRLWKKTKQQWENYLFQKPGLVFWWYSDKFEPIKSSGNNVHPRERRMGAGTSNHTPNYPLTSHPHLIRGVTDSSWMYKENEKPLMKESTDHLWENFGFPLKTQNLYPSVQRHPLSLQTTRENVKGTEDTQLGKGRLERDIIADFKYRKD